MRAVLFTLLLAIPLAKAQAMPSCVELKGLWYDHYMRDFKVAWDTGSFRCADQTAKRVDDSLVALAIYDLESARFERPKRAPNFYNLARTGITRLSFSSKCEDGVLATATGTEVELCPDFFTQPREDRAATLVHEARHTQSDDPSHVNCAGGKYKGDEEACDQKFYAGAWKGSGYNADVVFYDWNLKRSKGNELSKSVMKSMIRSLVPDRFNQISAKTAKAWRK